MAEILNTTYGKGADDVQRLSKDLQKLWNFKKVTTSTAGDPVLYVSDTTYLVITSGTTYAAIIKIYHHGMTAESFGSGDANALYAVKTNKALLMTYQSSSSSAVSNRGSLIVIGDAENPHTGDVETVLAFMRYRKNTDTDYHEYYPYICASDTSTTKINKSTYYNYNDGVSRNTVLVPLETNETSFIVKSVYRTSKQQAVPFIGDCTLNGRKLYSLGILFAEDD